MRGKSGRSTSLWLDLNARPYTTIPQSETTQSYGLVLCDGERVGFRKTRIMIHSPTPSCHGDLPGVDDESNKTT